MNTGTMSKTIDNVANEYRNNVEVDAVLLWDTMKMQIRSSSLKYAKEKKAKIKSKEKTLESDISSLRKQLEEGNLSDTAKSDICKELDIKTLQFEKISQYHTRGAILRSKARWYNEGEKISKYFLNLQKRHFNTKTIKQLKLDDNSVINTDDKILKEAKAFYQKLYTTSKEQSTPDHADIFFPEGFTEILDEQSQKECEGLLTDAECLGSLKTMSPNKSPGTDGLPAEFYKIFWDDVKPFLINALNHGYAKGHLSITQKRGMITLVPKKNKPAILLKNWRPITLLNCDYKIAAKSIANRVKKVLPKIINNDQTGFLKNRAIGENIRLIDSIIKYTNTKQMPGLLLFIDFEKAFDSLEWPFIEKTLRYFNFGMSLVKWFKLFYTDISSCIQNNGSSIGDGGSGPYCAKNPTQKKCAKNPKVKYFRNPKVKSQGQIFQECVECQECQGQNPKVKYFRNVWNVRNVRNAKVKSQGQIFQECQGQIPRSNGKLEKTGKNRF